MKALIIGSIAGGSCLVILALGVLAVFAVLGASRRDGDGMQVDPTDEPDEPAEVVEVAETECAMEPFDCLPDCDCMPAAKAQALLAEVTTVQESVLLDVPLQRETSEVGGQALYPPFNPLSGGRS